MYQKRVILIDEVILSENNIKEKEREKIELSQKLEELEKGWKMSKYRSNFKKCEILQQN